MSSEEFRFKRFLVRQDGCAMKVGTDGVLLGAWYPVEADCRRILDIGAGTGLISLMAAQRSPQALVTALEVDAMAAAQCRENVSCSEFAGRIRVVEADFNTWTPDGLYDLVLSNPPFYQTDLICPDARRSMARHGVTLTYGQLFGGVLRLLSPQGRLCVVIPSQAQGEVMAAARLSGLDAESVLRVVTRQGKPCKRLLMSFRPLSERYLLTRQETILLMEADGSRSMAYRRLTEDFYL